ncbi:MAG: molybdopterin-dependent oxidoreductase, partial [Burkholderiales bacterium]
GLPSVYEKNLARRESPGLTRVGAASVSFTPLQGLFGIITPNGLHFERHHQGWWDIDPAQHRLMINGLVKSARVFTLDDLMRLPSVSRIHFIECGANTGMEWGNVAVPTVQYTHGMLSCSEYTGVLLSTLLDLCGVDRISGQYVLAEGADGSSMTRTIPMDRAMDDVMVAWAMNGEMLRPENGYPLRLVVPGVQGVSWVKYLRRIEVGD